MQDAEVDARVDSLYRVIKGRIRWDNLIPTCLDLAHEVEQLTHLKGPQRLELLQKTLRFAIMETDKDPLEKEAILHFIDTVVPLAMQAAILASKIPIRQLGATCWKKCC